MFVEFIVGGTVAKSQYKLWRVLPPPRFRTPGAPFASQPLSTRSATNHTNHNNNIVLIIISIIIIITIIIVITIVVVVVVVAVVVITVASSRRREA